MNFFPQGLIIIFFFAAIISIVTALKIMNEKNNNGNLQVDNAINALNIATKEANNAMNELDKLSKSVFLEMENKYQEILYLYSTNDDKKSATSNLKKAESDYVEKIQNSKIKSKKMNTKSQEIMKLYLDGLGISEIAKILKLGVGEVNLIIELGKDR